MSVKKVNDRWPFPGRKGAGAGRNLRRAGRRGFRAESKQPPPGTAGIVIFNGRSSPWASASASSSPSVGS